MDVIRSYSYYQGFMAVNELSPRVKPEFVYCHKSMATSAITIICVYLRTLTSWVGCKLSFWSSTGDEIENPQKCKSQLTGINS